jgi:conjugative transfer signal peptidase TraF
MKLKQTAKGGALGLLVLISGTGALVVALTAESLGIRFNDSPSMPTGLYSTTTSDSDSTLVVFCPDGPFSSLSVQRGYRSRGNCPDGGDPLAKPVVAHPGEIVEFSADGLRIGSRLLPNTAPLATDTEGRPLSHWPFASYVVAPGTIWVASSYNPRSFDSRYFGPIALSQVREKVRPLLTTH